MVCAPDASHARFTDSLPWAVKAPANDWNDSLGSGMLGTKPHIQDFAEFLDDQAGDIRKESVGVPTGRRWNGQRREPGCHAHIGAVLVSLGHQERRDCRSPDDRTSIRCDNPAIPALATSSWAADDRCRGSRGPLLVVPGRGGNALRRLLPQDAKAELPYPQNALAMPVRRPWAARRGP